MNAPQFSLPDQNGANHTLEEFSGSWLVLYFYPKDDTPGCATEACSFRDSTSHFGERGIGVVGVSKDSVGSHLKFAQKYRLQFPLLSDPTGKIHEAYEVVGRKTVVINPEGEIFKVYENVTPQDHADVILSDLQTS